MKMFLQQIPVRKFILLLLCLGTLYSTFAVGPAIDVLNNYEMGYYMIRVNYSGKYLYVGQNSVSDNANIIQYENINTTNGHWALIPALVENGRQYFAMMARHSGKYANVQNASMEDRALIRQYKRLVNPKTGEIMANELFYLEKAPDGAYYIRAKHSGRFWNMKHSSRENGAVLEQFHLNAATATYTFHLIEKVDFSPEPKREEFTLNTPRHRIHTAETQPVKSKIITTYLPFYMVDDPLMMRPLEMSPYYTLVRTDYWVPVDYMRCPPGHSVAECTIEYQELQGWSKEEFQSMTHTTGISVAVEGSGKIGGIGIKTTVTASYSLGITKGSALTKTTDVTRVRKTNVSRGSSVVIWQLQANFKLIRQNGEVVKSWDTYVPGADFSTLYCSDVPCQ